MGFLVRGRVRKKNNKKKKTDRRKAWNNEEKEKWGIRAKSINGSKHLWFYRLYKRLYFVRKHSLEKLFCTIINFIYRFYALQDIWNAVIIHQSSCGFVLVLRSHDLWSETYINKLGTTTQIFIGMDYLILMSEKDLHFRKRQNHVARKFFPPHRSNWIHVLRKDFSTYVYLRMSYCVSKDILFFFKKFSNLSLAVPPL